MVVLKKIHRLSQSVEEYINITEEVHRIVEESGVKNGHVAVMTAHTTTGIMVNEALPCVETDISELLEKIVPLKSPMPMLISCRITVRRATTLRDI